MKVHERVFIVGLKCFDLSCLNYSMFGLNLRLSILCVELDCAKIAILSISFKTFHHHFVGKNCEIYLNI